MYCVPLILGTVESRDISYILWKARKLNAGPLSLNILIRVIFNTTVTPKFLSI